LNSESGEAIFARFLNTHVVCEQQAARRLGATPTVTGGNSSTGILNIYNLLEGEYSKGVQDIPQRFVITGLWTDFSSKPRPRGSA
jgi:hypothetical protein